MNYCDDCAQFVPLLEESEPVKSHELCNLKRKVQAFKAPASYADIHDYNWGHYFPGCPDFARARP